MSAGKSTYRHSFEALHVASLDAEQHERTCGYWYTVTDHAIAHAAFATRAGLERWLRERNLTLAAELPEQGSWGVSRIVGSYRDSSHLDVDEFNSIDPLSTTPVMSNGDYTLGLITADDDGIRTVHYLNPNVKCRLVFDYKQTREQMS